MTTPATTGTSTSEDIATRKREQLRAIRTTDRGAQLQTLDDYWTLANSIVGAGMSPMLKNGARMSAAQVMIAMQLGAEVGLPPMTSLKNVAVINNRPTLWGDAMLALIYRSGELEEFEEGVQGEGDKRYGFCTMKRRGMKARTSRFSVADAKTAGLWGKSGPWQTYPDRMLVMRSRGFTSRDVFPDKLGGFLMAEEVMDYGPAPAERGATGSAGLYAHLASPEPDNGVRAGAESADQEPSDTEAPPDDASDAADIPAWELDMEDENEALDEEAKALRVATDAALFPREEES